MSKWYSYLDGLEENMEPSTIQELLDYFLTIHKHQLSVIEKILYISLNIDDNFNWILIKVQA